MCDFMDYKKPSLTVDMFIVTKNRCEGLSIENEFILIKRKNNPCKNHWALPGGFVDYGETTESAAIREAKEETSMDIELIDLFGVYSKPDRDPRGHTVTIVYLAKGDFSQMDANDDAKDIDIFSFKDLNSLDLAFDHEDILKDIFDYINL